MAGPNEHHIPQFLQRSFGVKPKGKAPKEIWIYKRGDRPSLDRIDETAAEPHFYGAAVDSKISAQEDKLAKWYHQARKLSAGTSIDAQKAAELVGHLAPRSAHMRMSIASGMHRLSTAASDIFTDRAHIERMLGLNDERPTEIFAQKLRGAIDSIPGIRSVGLPEPVLERVAFYVARESFDSTVEEMIGFAGSLLTKWATESPAIARTSHNRGLEQIADRNVRTEYLARFSWKIEPAPPGGAILPDCIALAYGETGTLPLMLVGTDMHAVAMPLTSDRLLVGRTADARPHLSSFNRDAAACSQDFFLANADHEEFRKLADTIGTRVSTYLEDAMREAFEAVRPTAVSSEPNAVEENSTATFLPAEADLQFDYRVTLADFGDEELAQHISNILQPITTALARHLPLSRLEGITFAVDYATVLRNVERGRSDLPSVEAIHPSDAGAIGRMITVVRDGVVKGHIVFNGVLASCLMSEDADSIDLALAMVAHQLTLVAMLELIERRFPDTLLRPVSNGLQNQLYGQVHDALTGYVASRISSAFADASQSIDYARDELIQSVQSMKADIERERLAYRRHGDLGILLGVALPRVGRVLYMASALLGLCKSRDASIPDDDGRLSAALADSNLAHWVPDYERDLERFYDRLGGWQSMDEFLAFIRHAERLLWSVGLFPWESPGGPRVEVPLFSDAVALLSELEV